jgi:hypothetical protein
VIHGNLPSTDAVLAAQDAQHDGIDAEEVEIQPVRGVEKMPVGTRIEHRGEVWEIVLDADGENCDGCAACCDFDLCTMLYSCEAGGRDDGLDMVMREVVG